MLPFPDKLLNLLAVSEFKIISDNSEFVASRKNVKNYILMRETKIEDIFLIN
jgi:hypothetical protein